MWIFYASLFEYKTRITFDNRIIKENSNRENIMTEKKMLLTKMLFRKKICFSWDFFVIMKVNSEVYSSMKIRIVFHVAWQIFSFQILRVLNDTVSKMIKKRLRNEILKPCYDFYKNPWFLTKKKYEKIQIDQCSFWFKLSYNSRRQFRIDSRWFFETVCWMYDDFFDKFILHIWSIFFSWFFSKFDCFSNSIKLMQMTSLPQEVTNSIIQFMKIITRILMNHISSKAFSLLMTLKLEKFKISKRIMKKLYQTYDEERLFIFND